MKSGLTSRHLSLADRATLFLRTERRLSSSPISSSVADNGACGTEVVDTGLKISSEVE